MLALVLAVLVARAATAPASTVTERTASAAAEQEWDGSCSGGWREEFGRSMLARLGMPTTTENVEVWVEWTLSEDSGDGACERGNPLNTTLCTGADTGGCGDPLGATELTITNGYYDGVLDAMSSGTGAGVREAIWSSPWAASHYGYGQSWARR